MQINYLVEQRFAFIEKNLRYVMCTLQSMPRKYTGFMGIYSPIVDPGSASLPNGRPGYGSIGDAFISGQWCLNESERVDRLLIKIGSMSQGGCAAMGRDFTIYDIGWVEAVLSDGTKRILATWGY